MPHYSQRYNTQKQQQNSGHWGGLSYIRRWNPFISHAFLVITPWLPDRKHCHNCTDMYMITAWSYYMFYQKNAIWSNRCLFQVEGHHTEMVEIGGKGTRNPRKTQRVLAGKSPSLFAAVFRKKEYPGWLADLARYMTSPGQFVMISK